MGGIVSVGNHMAAAHFAAEIGDLAIVRFLLGQNYRLEQAEAASVEAFLKLNEYLPVAEDIERRHGVGALLRLDDEDVKRLIKLGIVTEAMQSAARSFRASPEALPTESIFRLLGDIASALQRRSGFNIRHGSVGAT